MAGRVDVLGIGFDRVALASAVRIILARLRQGERTFVVTANPEFVMLARRDAELRRIAAEADLVVPDGTGVLVASRLLGDPLPGRAPGRLIVDGKRVVEIHRDRHEGSWRSKSTHARGETIAMKAFPDVIVAVAEILPPVVG